MGAFIVRFGPPLGKRSRFYSSAQYHHLKIFEPPKFWKATHTAAMGTLILRFGPLSASDRFFIATHRVATENFSGPKRFGRQPMPQQAVRIIFF